MEARHIGLFIRANWQDVYHFAANPNNLHLWASGLSASTPIANGDSWLVDAPQGQVSLRFCPDNDLGVLDHWVTLPNGAEIYIPIRVIASGEFSEIIFTLFRQPDMSDSKFEEDANWVMKDLKKLAHNIENKK